MTFCDLLRSTVLLVAAVATALGMVAIIQLDREGTTLGLLATLGWWAAASAAGVWLGSPGRSAEAMRGVLAGARTTTSLPSGSAGRIALRRLWPILAFAFVVGGLAWLWPQLAAIGAGFALATALAWRGREAAVTAIEERDGVRFYVEPTGAFEPVRVVRTPGLGRERGTASA